jgi:hypothetical protein
MAIYFARVARCRRCLLQDGRVAVRIAASQPRNSYSIPEQVHEHVRVLRALRSASRYPAPLDHGENRLASLELEPGQPSVSHVRVTTGSRRVTV